MLDLGHEKVLLVLQVLEQTTRRYYCQFPFNASSFQDQHGLPS
jgi:hypothetical protein